MRNSLLVLISLGALAACGAPQDATLVIENTRIIIGDGRVIDHGHVAIDGDRIVYVSSEPIATRGGVERIDGAGKTVLPGLIDAHVHLTLERLFGQPRDDASMEDFTANRLPSRLQAFLEAGITTIMAAGEYRPFVLDVQKQVRSGALAGPRIYTTGSLITAPNGHPNSTICGFLDPGGPNPWCREHLSLEVETTPEAHAAVADLAGSGVDAVKFVFEDMDGSGNSALDPDLFDDIIDAARGHGLETYAHISDTTIAVSAIDAGLHRLVHLPTPTTDSSAHVQQLVERMKEDRVMASTTLTISADFARVLREQGQDL